MSAHPPSIVAPVAAFAAFAAAALTLTLAACGGGGGPAPARTAAVAAPVASAAVVERCDSVGGCEALCRRGGIPACAEASSRMLDHPLEASPERLVDALDRACAGGAAASCSQLATLLGSAPVLPHDAARIRSLRERGCALADLVSCLSLLSDVAALERSGSLGAADRARVERARELAAVRCDAQDGQACATLSAIHLVLGDPGRSSSFGVRAADTLEASCLGGVGSSCVPAARQVDSSMPPGDPERSRRLLERGCDLGVGEACRSLGSGPLASRRTPDETSLRRACAADSEGACLQLGEQLVRVHPATSPAASEGYDLRKRGLDLAMARCQLGQHEACSVLADALPRNLLPIDTARAAIGWLGGVCDLGDSIICASLARVLASPGLPFALLDLDRSALLERKACADGYPFACPDPYAALGFFRRLDASVVDRRSGLEWSAVSAQPETREVAARACAAPFRLPTRSDLATLLESPDKLRRAARVTLPARGRLWSGDLAAGAPAAGAPAAGAPAAGAPAAGAPVPLVMDVNDGRIQPADDRPAHRRCVRDLPRAAPAAPAFVLTVELRDGDPRYTLRNAAGRSVGTGPVIPVAASSSIWPFAAPGAPLGPVDVDIHPGVDVGVVVRFLGETRSQGVLLRRLTLDARPR